METSLLNDPLIIDSTFNDDYLQSPQNLISPSSFANNTAFKNRARVIQWDPHMGTEKSTITVILEQAVSNSTTSISEEVSPMKVVFGKLIAKTSQQAQRAPTASPTANLNSQLVWITLVAHVPKLSDTQIKSNNNEIPLSICSCDRLNPDIITDNWEFGVFVYKQGAKEENQGKKRSGDDSFSSMHPIKKPHSTSLEDDQLFNQLLAPFDDSPEITHQQAKVAISQSISANIVPTSTPENVYAPTQSHSLHSNSSSYSKANQEPAAMPLNYYYSKYGQQQYDSHSLTSQPSSIALQYGNANDSVFGFSDFSHQQLNRYAAPNMNYDETKNIPINNHQYNLKLFASQPLKPHPVRTTTEITPMTSRGITQSYPFAGVVTRANLKIVGDLNDMKNNWSSEEWNNNRRLVQFWRKQHGTDDVNEVECGFHTIEQDAYYQQRALANLNGGSKKKDLPLVISIIYWEQKNDYFVTSVDCVYLLEGLVGVQFTVEEKNRIRRNLEGFKPLTVSKCKPETAEFFKLIMGFPHPKPRNIEKDVKVFPWSILPSALKKIMRKYTPSYSSTVVANLNR